MRWSRARISSFIVFVVIVVLLTAVGCGGGNQLTIDSETGVKESAKGGNGGKAKPVAVPGAYPIEGGVPMLVHLFDDGSFDSDGEIVKWEWNFSDPHNGQGGWHDFTNTQGDAWHTYNHPGNQVAHLRVTDNDGRRATNKVKIIMRHDLNAAPVAVGNAKPAVGCPPHIIDFNAEDSYDPDGEIIEYAWDFGDGSGWHDATDSVGEITHLYESAGFFTAQLRLTDDDGAQTTLMVEVGDVRVPSLELDGISAQSGMPGIPLSVYGAGIGSDNLELKLMFDVYQMPFASQVDNEATFYVPPLAPGEYNLWLIEGDNFSDYFTFEILPISDLHYSREEFKAQLESCYSEFILYSCNVLEDALTSTELSFDDELQSAIIGLLDSLQAFGSSLPEEMNSLSDEDAEMMQALFVNSELLDVLTMFDSRSTSSATSSTSWTDQDTYMALDAVSMVLSNSQKAIAVYNILATVFTIASGGTGAPTLMIGIGWQMTFAAVDYAIDALWPTDLRSVTYNELSYPVMELPQFAEIEVGDEVAYSIQGTFASQDEFLYGLFSRLIGLIISGITTKMDLGPEYMETYLEVVGDALEELADESGTTAAIEYLEQVLPMLVIDDGLVWGELNPPELLELNMNRYDRSLESQLQYLLPRLNTGKLFKLLTRFHIPVDDKQAIIISNPEVASYSYPERTVTGLQQGETTLLARGYAWEDRTFGIFSLSLRTWKESALHSFEVTTPPPPSYPIWEDLPNIPRGRQHCMVLEYDGNLIMCSGAGQGGSAPSRRFDHFNTTTYDWTADAYPMIPAAHEDYDAIILGDELYTIGGGWGPATSDVYILDLVTSTWSTGPSINHSRCYSNSVVIDGKIYVIGGRGNTATGGAYISPIEVLDPSTGSWTVISNYPVARSPQNAVAVGQKIHFMGEFDDSGTHPVHRIFDTVTGTWSSETMPYMNWSIWTPVGYQDGYIYVYFAFDNISARYDVNSGEWMRGTPRDNPVTVPSGGMVGDRIYMFHGGSWQTNFCAWTPVSDTFTPMGGGSDFNWTYDVLRTGSGEGVSIDLALHPDTEYPLVSAGGQHTPGPPDPYAAQIFQWNGTSWEHRSNWAMHLNNGTAAAYYSAGKLPCFMFARNPDSGDDLWFYSKDASGWQSLDHVANGTPWGLSAASDPSNSFALYLTARWGQVKYYTHSTSANWPSVTIDSVSGSYTDCWIADNGNHYIAYDDTAGDRVKLAWGSPSSFTTTVIPDSETTSYASRVGIAGFNTGGAPLTAVVYRDKANSRLRYAEYNGSSWLINTIDDTSNPGEYCSIDFDATGNRYVAYYAAASGDLHLAQSSDGVNWSTSIVDDSAGNVGIACVIKVTDDGRPRIAYGELTPTRSTRFAWGEF